MRKKNGGVWHLAQTIADDLEDRETGIRRQLRLPVGDNYGCR